MKKIVEFLGLAGAVGAFFVMLLTFLTAYKSPSKEVLIPIDSYGEANFEIVMLVLLIPCVVYAFFMGIKKLC